MNRGLLSLRSLAILVPAALFAVACEKPPPDSFTPEEWELIQELTPLPAVPANPTNKYADDPAAAVLGQKLFFETRYAGALKVAADGTNGGLGQLNEKGKVSCASCHLPGYSFADNRSNPNNLSLGTGWTTRNTPSLLNVAYYEWHGWGGKQDSLWTQASLSPESSENTSGNRCGYAHMLWDYYRAEYDAVFDEDLPTALASGAHDAARFPASCKPKKLATDPDGAWELMAAADRDIINRIMANQGKAVAAYERKLVNRNAPFDLYVAGAELSPAATRGLQLFVGKAFCVQCHAGPAFSDNEYHNLGVPQEGTNVPTEDAGRIVDLPAALKHTFHSASVYSDDPAFGAAKQQGRVAAEADRGTFRTKALRGVALTPPYMHNGRFASLREVVDFYDEGGGTEKFVGVKDDKLEPLNLTDSEKDDLVAFLESLTGEPVPSELTVNPLAL